MRQSRERLLVAGILAAAAVLRLTYLSVYAQRLPFFRFPFGDAELYLDWAQRIMSGQAVGPGVFYRAPLYAYLLAGLLAASGGRLVAVYLAQAACGLATGWLTYAIGRRLFGRTAGVAALLLLVLNPVLPFLETKLLSASWAVFFTVLGSYLLLLALERPAWWRWLVCGLGFGAGILAWPGSAFVPLLAVVFVVLSNRRKNKVRTSTFEVRRSGPALLAAGCLLAVLPATVHNAVAGRDFVPVSANGGFTFYQGNNRLAVGTLAQPPEVYEFQREGRYLTGIAEQETFERQHAEARAGRALKPSEVSRFWLGRALSWMASRPGDFALLLLRKAGLAFADYESPLNYDIEVEAELVWPLRLMVARFGLVLALAAVAVLFGRTQHQREVRSAKYEVRSSERKSTIDNRKSKIRKAWPAYALVAGSFLALFVFYVAARYRALALPGLAVLGGVGAAILWERFRRRRGRLAPVAAGLAAFLASAVVLVLPLRRGSLLLRANGFRSLAETYHYRAADREKAEQAYLRAIRLQEENINPRSVQERVALAETRELLARLRAETASRPDTGRADAARLLARGDTANAILALETLIERDSGDRQAYLVLGAVHGARARHREAQAVFSAAVARFSQDPVLLYNLGLAALNAGDTATAFRAGNEVLGLVPNHPWARRLVAEATR